MQEISVSLNELEGHIGKVAKCGKGRIAVITGKDYTAWSPDEKVWIGVGLDGVSWSSKKPEIISDSIIEYLKKGAD